MSGDGVLILASLLLRLLQNDRNDSFHPKHSNQWSVNLCPPFVSILRNRWASGPVICIFRLLFAPVGSNCPFIHRKLNCLLKHCANHLKLLRYHRICRNLEISHNPKICSKCKKNCSKSEKFAKTLPSNSWKTLAWRIYRIIAMMLLYVVCFSHQALVIVSLSENGGAMISWTKCWPTL